MSTPRPRRHRRLPAPVLLALALSCAHPQTPGLPVTAAARRAERAALGPIGDPLAPGGPERLRRLAEVAAALGNRADASAAATEYLRQARITAALAGQPTDEVRAIAIDLAGRLHDAPLLIEAARPRGAGDTRFVEPYLAALSRSFSVSDDDYRRAAQLAGDRPTLLGRIEGRAWVTDAPAPLARIAGGGQAAMAALDQRLDRAAGAVAAPGELAAIARAILTIDPFHIDAGLVARHRADVAAGTVTGDARLAADIAGADGAPGFTRLAAQSSDAASVRLGLAAAYLRAGLVGDAAVAIRAYRADAPEDELAAAIAARISLAAGDLGAWRHWRDDAGAADSFDVIAAELATPEVPLFAELRRHAARRALMLGVAPRWQSYAIVRQVAVDHDAPAALRQRAITELRWYEPNEGALADECVARRLHRVECAARMDADDRLDEQKDADEVVAALERLIDSAGFDERWLVRLVEQAPATAVRIRPLLARLAGTRVASTGAYVSARVQTALAAGAPAAARAHLDDGGALLTAMQRAVLTVAIAELEAAPPAARTERGAQVYERIWTPSPPPVPLPAPRAAPAPREEDGPLLALRRAGMSWWYGDAAAAHRAWAELARAAGPAGEPLWAWAAHAAAIAGDREATEAALARIPASPARALVAGYLAYEAGDYAAAASHYESVLARFPTDHLPLAGYVGALAATAGAPRALAFLRAAAPTQPPWIDELLAAAPSFADGDTLRRHVEAVDDEAIAADLGAARTASARAAAVRGLKARIAGRDGGDDDVARALADLLARAGGEDDVDERAWALFLAGDGEAARELITRPRDGEPRIGEQLAFLAEDRPGAIGDELALALWKHYRHERGDAVELATRLGAVGTGASARAACRLLLDADVADQALTMCWRAWRRGYADSDLAAAVTWLAAERTEEVERMGIDLDSFFESVGRTVTDPGDVWRANVAIFYERAGDARRSAELLREAIAHGYQLEPALPGELALRQAEWIGPAIRHAALRADGPAAGLSQAAFVSLTQGDTESAGAYLAAASARGFHDADAASWHAWRVALFGLAHADRRGGALDAAGARAWNASPVWNDVGEPGLRAAEALRARYPRSDLLATALLVACADALDLERGAPLARELLARWPHNAVVAGAAATLRAHAGERDAAQEILARARKADPDNAYLARVDLGAERVELGWLGDHAETRARLAAVSTAALRALAPRPVTRTASAAEAFVPADADTADDAIRTAAGSELRLEALPRASMCAPLECMTELAGSFADGGMPEVWRGPLDIAAGPAAEALFHSDSQDRVAYVLAFPSGGRIFQLSLAGKVAAVRADLAAARLLADTFRPIDRVLPADRAAALRARITVALPPAEVRLAARAALRGTGACPIAALLDTVETPAALLTDLAVGATPTQLRTLLGCVDVEALSGELAILALLSDDARSHQLGRAAALLVPDDTLAAARIALEPTAETTLSTVRRVVTPRLARFGWVEVLLALPAPQRRELAGELFRSTDSNRRAAAYLAAAIAPDTIDRTLLRGEIRTAAAPWATLAAAVIDQPDADDLAAMRARLVEIHGQAGFLDLSAMLGEKLATHGSDRDRALTREGILARLGAISPPRTPAPAPPRRSPVPADALAAAPLPALLDGDWSYARLSQPGLVRSALAGMIPRLRVERPDELLMLHRMGAALADFLGVGALHPDSGLDLERPIECASPGTPATDGFVCAAHVRDADALRGQLARRSFGADSGLALPITAAHLAADAPLMAARAPALLAGLGVDERGPLSAFLRSLGAGDDVLGEERVRHTVRVAGHAVDHLAVVRVRDGRVEIDDEHYLFVGDRVLLFSSRALAERILTDRPPRRASLAGKGWFRRLSTRWRDGGALQAILPPGAAPVGGTGAAAIEIATGRNGLTLRVRTARQRNLRTTTTGATLPPGSLAHIELPGGNARARAIAPGASMAMLLVAGPRPPSWLTQHAAALTFGWYPAGSTWARWVAVAPDSPPLRDAMRDANADVGRAVEKRGQVYVARRARRIIVGSTRALVLETATRAEKSRATGTALRGVLDGVGVAEALRTADSERDRNMATVVAPFAAALGRVAIETRTVGAEQLIETRIEPQLVASDEIAGLGEAVGRWLASPRIRNAVELPRSLASRELYVPVTYTVEVEDATAVAERVFGGVPRVSVDIVDGRHLQVTVAPGPQPGTAVTATALSADERGRLTGALSPTIARLAASIVPEDATPGDAAARVITWLQNNLRYEITPVSGDATDIARRLRGDCSEYAELAVAILRAADVPARTKSGMAAAGREIVAHAWVEFHDGVGWREFDPTFGQAWVGAGHIEASLLDVMAMVSLGQLRITAIETE